MKSQGSWRVSLYLAVASAVVGCGDESRPVDDMEACSNGLDDDGDGRVDYPADPGCQSADDADESDAALSACSDGKDNDGDGKADYPNDPGCLVPQDTDEADECPGGASCPACGNGLDDDGDGAADFPDDTGCTSASGTTELQVDPNGCGPGVLLIPLSGNRVSGMIPEGGTSDASSARCGGVGEEVVFQFAVSEPKFFRATTSRGDSVIDTVMYLRSTCSDGGTELACNDDAPGSEGSTIEAQLTAGTYYLFVDGKDADVSGEFQLDVELRGGPGSSCTTREDCGPDLFCRPPAGGGSSVCQRSACSDGADNDGDTKSDYPNDPGCAIAADDDETDDCPSGPGCPACADGVDNDGDSHVDYPADTDCSSASQPTESCGLERDPILAIGQRVTKGTLVGSSHGIDLSCDVSTANERIHMLTLPDMSSLSLVGESEFDTVLAVMPATCSGTELGCNDNGIDAGVLNFGALEAGTYAVVMSNYGGSTVDGPYSITTSGVIAPGGRCDGALAQSAAIACGPSYSCVPGEGGSFCRGTQQCNNGSNDDGDAWTDYPDDPGCETPDDNSEADACPGPGCPACADGVDNDGDTHIDYPDDVSCRSASGTDESCTSSEVVTLIGGPVTASTLIGATDDADPACASSDGSGPDRLFQIDLPALRNVQVSVRFPDGSFDSVHVLSSSCDTGAPLVCSDAAQFTQADLAAGRYYVLVDTYRADTQPRRFEVHVAGAAVIGSDCEGPLFASGVLRCEPSSACKGSAGSRTCQLTACADNVDADGDSHTGYPSDPGCINRDDDDESDACPAGPGCPACSNDIDDDGDGLIDWPSDAQCASASQNSEACITTEPVAVITSAQVEGTTTGQIDDIDPSCASTLGSGPDRIYAIDLPSMASFSATVDATWDAVLVMYGASCAAPALDCGDDPPEATVGPLGAGRYYLNVDGYRATNSGTYTLNVTGRIAAGGDCSGPLATGPSPALQCTVGTTCTAGTCQ